MDFAPDSIKIMSFMMKSFKSFYKPNTPEKQEGMDTLLRDIYYKIKEASTDITLIKKNNNINKTIKENKILHNSTDGLFYSKFVPDSIRSYIKTNFVGEVIYNTRIGDRKLKITFNLMNNNDFNELDKLNNLFDRLLLIYTFLTKFSENKCSKTIHIRIYLTDIKKMLPYTSFKVLGPLHVNSAVTTHCQENGEILIYRKEELMKVFIHECIHSLGLDWFEMNLTPLKSKLKNIFKINTDMIIPEAYTEFWACILNSCFTAYFLNNTKIEEYLLFSEYCIQFEQMFSLFQMSKILRFMGLHYKSLYETDNLSQQSQKYLYRENSNVFVYYILKTILLYNAFSFMKHCKKNNDNLLNMKVTEKNMEKLFDFIKFHYKKPNFLQDISKMYLLVKNLSNKRGDEFISRTLRMTAMELV